MQQADWNLDAPWLSNLVAEGSKIAWFILRKSITDPIWALSVAVFILLLSYIIWGRKR